MNANFSRCRVNLVEVHTSLLLMCLLEADLPNALIEVIVSSDSFLSLQAIILLGKLKLEFYSQNMNEYTNLIIF